MMDEEKTKKFLAELSSLSRKYGIEIAGCGCCGSPFLMPANKGHHYKVEDWYTDGHGNLYAEKLEFVEKD
jgi:hypothetical protein